MKRGFLLLSILVTIVGSAAAQATDEKTVVEQYPVLCSSPEKIKRLWLAAAAIISSDMRTGVHRADGHTFTGKPFNQGSVNRGQSISADCTVPDAGLIGNDE